MKNAIKPISSIYLLVLLTACASNPPPLPLPVSKLANSNFEVTATAISQDTAENKGKQTALLYCERHGNKQSTIVGKSFSETKRYDSTDNTQKYRYTLEFKCE